jgi:preprotein translocase subunit SecD
MRDASNMKLVLSIVTLVISLTSCSGYSKLKEGATCYIRNPQPTDGIYEKGASGLNVVDSNDHNDTLTLNHNTFLDARSFYRIKIGAVHQDGKVELIIYLNREGADDFADLTESNTGSKLYYLVDGMLVYSVNIGAQIMDGSTFMVVSKKQFDKLFKTF